jgi:hypothetical protein
VPAPIRSTSSNGPDKRPPRLPDPRPARAGPLTGGTRPPLGQCAVGSEPPPGGAARSVMRSERYAPAAGRHEHGASAISLAQIGCFLVSLGAGPSHHGRATRRLVRPDRGRRSSRSGRRRPRRSWAGQGRCMRSRSSGDGPALATDGDGEAEHGGGQQGRLRPRRHVVAAATFDRAGHAPSSYAAGGISCGAARAVRPRRHPRRNLPPSDTVPWPRLKRRLAITVGFGADASYRDLGVSWVAPGPLDLS